MPHPEYLQSTASIPTLIGRAFKRQCPVCGYHPIWKGWMTLVDSCPNCGYVFRREGGYFLGALRPQPGRRRIHRDVRPGCFLVWTGLGVVGNRAGRPALGDRPADPLLPLLARPLDGLDLTPSRPKTSASSPAFGTARRNADA